MKKMSKAGEKGVACARARVGEEKGRKKPRIFASLFRGGDNFRCPACDAALVPGTKKCECGQRLNWDFLKKERKNGN